MLQREYSVLGVVDIQEKLLPKIAEAGSVLENALKLAAFAREAELPILWAEQYPKGLGPSVPEVQKALEGRAPIEKTSFGCMGCSAYSEALAATGRNQLLLTGIETHVCVLQTALAAHEEGYQVFVARDAVGSREPAQHETALQRLQASGIGIVTTEMALFELLGESGTALFKTVLPLIKG